ncbi:metal-sensing transcriptional repressor [Alkaliphilus hydrothermalis]|uniref:DNA-binding FrmR family transcriptional regulator n=1 Tax=Alkaliphilus hydrothermalis TaxID=1482730 RepID=A0ABS2NSC1_9FIRM|nr:metal-sensing transcriptional repressor [Alkaliphilus hydrothermalis]MBM7615860.1 DNA-binding FrmR family transcriptional regulator [Alkaliphilus hydrothermalis]
MKSHKHPQQKQVINRMARIVGHAEAIKKMCEEEKECSEILIQIAAVKSALNNVGKLILKNHINHCIVEAVEARDETALEKLEEAIDKFMK